MEIAGHSIGVGSNYVQEGLVMDLRNFVLGKADFPEGMLTAERGYTIDLCGTWIGAPVRDGSDHDTMLNGKIWTLGFCLDVNNENLTIRYYAQETKSIYKKTDRFSLAFSVASANEESTKFDVNAYAAGKKFYSNSKQTFGDSTTWSNMVKSPISFQTEHDAKTIHCDRFSVYDRVLSAEEIARNHEADEGRFGI